MTSQTAQPKQSPKDSSAFKVPQNTAAPVPEEILEQLRAVGPSTICHALYDLGFANTFLRGIAPMAYPEGCEGFVGIARTLRFLPKREDLVAAQYAENTRSPHRIAIEELSPGEILLIDCGGNLESGVLGDIFTLRVKQRGGTAVVIDGAVRDLKAIKLMELPVFAKGVHGSEIPRAQMSVGVNEPVCCGGVPVVPGDILVGNEDGVVVVPPQIAEQVAKQCYPKLDYEKWIRGKLRTGGDLHWYYQHPPRPEVVDEYRKERGLPDDFEIVE